MKNQSGLSQATNILAPSCFRLRLPLMSGLFFALCLAFLTILLHSNRQNNLLLRNLLLIQAQDLVKQVTIAPFFENIHHTADSPFSTLPITTTQNTAKNGISMHLISLSPLNPLNHLDLFEIKSLHDLENNAEEIKSFATIQKQTIFRYIAPLASQPSCHGCHNLQDTDSKNIIGGLSIAIIDKNIIFKGLQRNRITFFVILGISGVFFTLAIFFLYFIYEEYRANKKAVQQIANRDFLTNLPNRREGLRRLGEELSKSIRSNQNLTVILLDIDRFKIVNEILGNDGGDEILREVAATLAGFMRDYDILSRFGGEEFLIVLPATTLTDGLTIAERLRETIGNKTFNLTTAKGSTIRITASQGIATLQAEESLDAFIARVDQALRAAKDRGRNNVTEA